MQRKIIHIDMDAFYAAIEQRDNPELRGKPIAVGGSSARGVVMTASYEARVFGVRSAMPSVTALRKCPDIIFVKSRMDKYREASKQIRDIFFEYTELVEPLSLDEAYLDVTENKKGEPYAINLADEIRERIYEETGLTASAGVSYNKFLAKIASDINKPNGRTVIRPDQAEKFLENLPIEKFHGVGRVTAEKMREMGITNGATLKNATLETLTKRFGKAGNYYYHVVRGQDNREVKPNRVRKSVGAENTFSQNVSDLPGLQQELEFVLERLEKRIEKVNRPGFTITLKLKSSEFKVMNRSLTSEQPFTNIKTISETAHRILKTTGLEGQSFRLIGVSISNFRDYGTSRQGELGF